VQLNNELNVPVRGHAWQVLWEDIRELANHWNVLYSKFGHGKDMGARVDLVRQIEIRAT